MRKALAAAGTLAFLIIAPGVVAGLVPWLLTGWEAASGRLHSTTLQVVGSVLIGVGAVVVLESFARFVFEGLGTPAPVAPTERLVVGGFYRYVRNPMYLAVGAIIVGQALLLGRVVLLVYAAAFTIAVVSFVRWYEEPTLQRQFGEEWEAYSHAVPAWLPRLRPWEPNRHEERR